MPPACASDSFAPPAAAYRRAARRLRNRLAHQPGQLHYSLLALAKRHDAQTAASRRPEPRRTPGAVAVVVRPARVEEPDTGFAKRNAFSAGDVGAVLEAPAGATEGFAALVGRQMEGTILTYPRRQALLRAARRLGIGRFEANLVIAAVQHRRPAEALSPAPLPLNVWWVALILVAAEALAAGAAWSWIG